MPATDFDATITIGYHHLLAAGLDPRHGHDAIVDAARAAVQRLEGAHWIDVIVADFPSACPGWVTRYPHSRSIKRDTPAWHARRHQVEEVVKAALVAAAAPF